MFSFYSTLNWGAFCSLSESSSPVQWLYPPAGHHHNQLYQLPTSQHRNYKIYKIYKSAWGVNEKQLLFFFFGGCAGVSVSVGGPVCTCVLALFPGRLPYVTFEPPGEAQGGLDHDVCGLGFSNYGNVPMCQIAIDSKRYKTTQLLFQFIAMTQKTAP